MLDDSQFEQETTDREPQGLPPVSQEWLSIQQLQDLLGIGHTKAYSLVASGEIPSVKIGRIIRINQRDLGEWLDQQKSRTVTN